MQSNINHNAKNNLLKQVSLHTHCKVAFIPRISLYDIALLLLLYILVIMLLYATLTITLLNMFTIPLLHNIKGIFTKMLKFYFIDPSVLKFGMLI